MKNHIKSEDQASYSISSSASSATSARMQRLEEDDIIRQAINILGTRLMVRRMAQTRIHTSEEVKQFLQLKFSAQEREVFSCLFLDNQYRPIRLEEVFYGTINGASIHPREVVKKAMEHNAAAVIFCHNHPSGDTAASEADKQITKRLQEAMALVDVEVLDHIIVGEGASSMREQGEL